MGLHVSQFLEWVVRPTLEYLDPEIPYSRVAEQLVLGTAVHESGGLVYLDQTTPGPGPAAGLFQMERATYTDHYRFFISRKPEVKVKVEALLSGWPDDKFDQLRTNLPYATAFCRVHYRRVKEALPDENDLNGIATYWKRWYNTSAGKGTVAEFIKNYNKFVG